jgi:hypothetical protein
VQKHHNFLGVPDPISSPSKRSRSRLKFWELEKCRHFYLNKTEIRDEKNNKRMNARKKENMKERIYEKKKEKRKKKERNGRSYRQTDRQSNKALKKVISSSQNFVENK